GIYVIATGRINPKPRPVSDDRRSGPIPPSHFNRTGVIATDGADKSRPHRAYSRAAGRGIPELAPTRRLLCQRTCSAASRRAKEFPQRRDAPWPCGGTALQTLHFRRADRENTEPISTKQILNP